MIKRVITAISPEIFFRYIVKILIPIIYRTNNIGFHHIPKRGPALLIANHVSFMDGIVIQAACNRPIRFVIDKYIYELPGVNYFMRHNQAIPVFPKKDEVSRALDEISEALERGDLVCIFPEGQLTYTGNLGRFKPGIEWIIDRDPVPIYPIALKGLWGSIFSRKYLRSRFRWFPKTFRRKVTVICGKEIHPGSVHVNHLQREVLALKNSIE
jgi:1-acyl-sn-glycerol-3-phosphate acyltransferase